MDQLKQMIHAVAGSGKTSLIIDELNLDKNIVIITYTIANQNLIKEKIIRKFGYIPDNINVFGFWQFIYDVCLIPFRVPKYKGIIFDDKIKKKFFARDEVNNYIFNNKISKVLIEKKYPYTDRINNFFDEIYIDEVQDFDGYDLDWIMSLAQTKIKVWVVGDFYQKTYSTSRVGNKNSKVVKNYNNYKKKFEESGYILNETKLNKSYRCTKNICKFVSDKLGINIESQHKEMGNIQLLENSSDIEKIMKNSKVKKLFYQKHYNYSCNSANWGESKGMTYSKVCVVLNKTTFNLYKKNELKKLKPATKAKFYVAVTRSAGNLYFIEEDKLKKFKKAE